MASQSSPGPPLTQFFKVCVLNSSNSSFRFRLKRLGKHKKPHMHYLAVSWDIYYMLEAKRRAQPSSFREFRGAHIFEIKRGSSCVILNPENRPRVLRVYQLSTTGIHDENSPSLTIECSSDADMHRIAEQIRNASKPLGMLLEGLKNNLLTKRVGLNSSDLGDLRLALDNSVALPASNTEETPEAGDDGIANRIVEISAYCRGAFEDYQNVTNWAQTFVGVIGGAQDAVNVVEKVCSAVPIVSLIAPIIGLVGTLAAAEADRQEANKDAADLKQQCLLISKTAAQAILRAVDFEQVDTPLIARLFEVLNTCWDTASKAERFAMKKTRHQYPEVGDFKTLQDQVKETREGLNNLEILTGLAENRNLLKQVVVAPLEKADNFKPAKYYGPAPTVFAYLDFSPQAMTPESTLKEKLLSPENKSGGLIGVWGMSGVGKSTILASLVRDEQVTNTFTGGIYWFRVGQGCSADVVISELACATREANCTKTCDEIGKTKFLSRAVTEAKKVFEGHCCLFVFDDLSPESSPDAFLQELRLLSSEEAGSRAVFSSRYREIVSIARGCDTVEIEPREHDSFLSRRIIWNHADLAESEIEYAISKGPEDADVRSFENVLKMCAGLPLSLAVVGKAIQRYKIASRPFKGFAEFDSTSDSNPPQSTTLEMPGMEGYLGFKKVMDATWSMLESNDRTIAGRPVSELRELHAALCIFGKQVQVPASVLQRLWRIELEAVKLIAMGMSDLSLVDYRNDASGTTAVSVHDLIHAYCVREAERSDTVPAQWHRRLVDGYPCAKEDTTRKWWECDSIHDGYLRQNLARHLLGGKIDHELHTLLLDYRWVHGCVTSANKTGNGNVELQTIEKDYALLVDSLKKSQTFEQGVNGDEPPFPRWYAFTVIPEAVRLSWSPILEWPSETAFQMHGRLFHLSSVHGVHEFLESLELHAQRPWIRSVRQSLIAAGGSLRRSVPLGDGVRSAVIIPNSRKVLVGTKSGACIVDLETGSEERRLHPDNEQFFCVSVSGDGQYGCGGCDGKVYIWALQSCDFQCRTICVGNNIVWAVAMLADGIHVATGSGRGLIQFWNYRAESRHEVQLEANASVKSMRVSPSGNSIACGLADGKVMIWDISELGNARSQTPKTADLRGGVSCVAWGPDEKHIVVGVSYSHRLGFMSWCKEAYSDIVSGVGLSRLVVLSVATVSEERSFYFRRRYLRSLSYSRDGQYIISGWQHGSILICDVLSGRTWETPNGHTDDVRAVEQADHGGVRLITGSYDGKVKEWEWARMFVNGNVPNRQELNISELVSDANANLIATDGTTNNGRGVYLWNASNGELSRVLTTKHHGYLHKLVFSPKSRWLASVSELFSVRIWDTESGEEVSREMPPEDTYSSEEDMSSLDSTDPEACKKWLSRYLESIEIYETDGKSSGTDEESSGTAENEVGSQEPSEEACINTSVSDTPGLVGDVLDCLVFSPLENIYVTGFRNGTVRIWKVEGPEDLFGSLHGHTGSVGSLAFSPNGKILASGSAELILWDLDNGTRPTGRQLSGHGEITCLAFESNGRILASGSAESSVCLWDTERCERVFEPQDGHSGKVTCLDFSANGQLLASGCDKGVIIIWRVETGEKAREPTKIMGVPVRLRVIENVKVSVDVEFNVWNEVRMTPEDDHICMMNTYVEAEGTLQVANYHTDRRFGFPDDDRDKYGNRAIYLVHGAQSDGERPVFSLMGRFDEEVTTFWYHRDQKKLWVQLSDRSLEILELVEEENSFANVEACGTEIKTRHDLRVCAPAAYGLSRKLLTVVNRGQRIDTAPRKSVRGLCAFF